MLFPWNWQRRHGKRTKGDCHEYPYVRLVYGSTLCSSHLFCKGCFATFRHQMLLLHNVSVIGDYTLINRLLLCLCPYCDAHRSARGYLPN